MTNWLDRHFVLGCILAAVVQFIVAGIFLLGAVENHPSTIQDAALWAILGLTWLGIAVVVRSRSSARADH